MSVHKIRLAGPWEWLPVGSPNAAESRERKPCQLPFPEASTPAAASAVMEATGVLQPVWLFRRFHCPTGIDESIKVLLAVELRHGVVQLQLNGADIVRHSAVADSVRFDVTSSLKPFNELGILFAGDDSGSHAARVVAVCLEMHASYENLNGRV